MNDVMKLLSSAEISQTTNIPDNAFFLTGQGIGKAPIIIYIEPGTAAVLFQEILKAILIELGVRALSSIVGAPEDNTLMKRLIEEITSSVRQSLEEEAIRQAQDRMNGVIRLVREYNNSPDTRGSSLEYALHASSELVSLLEPRLPLSANGYILAASTRLAILQEWAMKKGGGVGDKKNVSDFAKEIRPHIERARDTLFSINAMRVSGIDAIQKFNCTRQSREVDACISGYYWLELTYSADGASHVIRSDHYQPNRTPQHIWDATWAIANDSRNRDLALVEEDFLKRVGIALQNTVNNVVAISQMYTS